MAILPLTESSIVCGTSGSASVAVCGVGMACVSSRSCCCAVLSVLASMSFDPGTAELRRDEPIAELRRRSMRARCAARSRAVDELGFTMSFSILVSSALRCSA